MEIADCQSTGNAKPVGKAQEQSRLLGRALPVFGNWPGLGNFRQTQAIFRIGGHETCRCAVRIQGMNKPNSASNDQEDQLPLTEWINAYRDSLRTMVDLRMDRRLRSRVDPSDILQETFIEAARRIDEQQASDMSPRLWLRFLAKQQLMIAWRRHGLAKSRDVTREQPGDSLSVSGDALLQAIAQSATSPSQHLMHEETLVKLKTGLDELEEIDREVLVMRHFEQLSIQETAECLEISVAAASRRYYRALKRISDLMIPQTE